MVGLPIKVKEYKFDTEQTAYIMELVEKALLIGGKKERAFLIPTFKDFLKGILNCLDRPEEIKQMIEDFIREWSV